jgi:hypothetical protein
MQSALTTTLAVALAAAPLQRAIEDEVHPRAPDKPLTVTFTPFSCPRCVKERRIEGPEREVRFVRVPLRDLLKSIDYSGSVEVVESPNFRILSTLGRARVKHTDSRFAAADLNRLKTILPDVVIDSQGAHLNAHQRAHLYAIRAERILAHFSALTGNTKPFLGMMGHYEFCLFEDYQTHHRFVDKYMGRAMDKMGAQGHQKEPPNFFFYSTYEGLAQGSDRNLSNHFIHSVAHNLIDGYDNYIEETPAWLEEGLAHYYERREHTAFHTFCWAEGKPPTMFEKPEWAATILNLVRRGKDASLSLWCEKLLPGELTAEEQGICWSIVKWLIETEPVRFAAMIDKAQDFYAKPTSTQCIEHAFGVSPGVLHQRWREHVLKEYPKLRE